MHRPFGTFVLHTATGSLVCREPSEALQMLFLTMAHQSTAVGTRPLDAVDEHFIGRYRVSRRLTPAAARPPACKSDVALMWENHPAWCTCNKSLLTLKPRWNPQ